MTISKPGDVSIERRSPVRIFFNQVAAALSRDAFSHNGFEVSEDSFHSNAFWGRQFPLQRYMSIKGWQRCNHFAGAKQLGQKACFHKRMSEAHERTTNRSRRCPCLHRTSTFVHWSQVRPPFLPSDHLCLSSPFVPSRTSP
jgi:hypothetical protein